MAGHSKWAQIKRKKAAKDQKRGKLFTKILREITVAARLGGGDISSNPRLRVAVREAKAANVPLDNIERAIKRGIGDLEVEAIEEMLYEGYAPEGVAVIVEAITNNKNRTASELRHLFSKYGGRLVSSGSVAWMFERKGLIVIDSKGRDEESLLSELLEFEIEDLAVTDSECEIYTEPKALSKVADQLIASGEEVKVQTVAWVPNTYKKIGLDKVETVMDFLDKLENHDDVQKVWTNISVE